MPALFGYRVEPDFDITKEKRTDRVGWAIYGGTALCLVYLTWGRPFAAEIFQGCLATILFYGDNFYVRQRNALGKLWLWKAISATIPFHVLYLAGMFWTDWAFPEVMTKAMVFIPLVGVGFAVESVLMEGLIKRFKPSAVDAASSPATRT